MTERSDTLMSFPCDYAFKIMGRSDDNFTQHVYKLLKPIFSMLQLESIQAKASKNGNFISLTIPVTAESKAQLDKAYAALTQDKLVLASF